MKRFLTVLCLMLYVAAHAIGENPQMVSDTISVDKLVMKNSRWTYLSGMLPSGKNGPQSMFWYII